MIEPKNEDRVNFPQPERPLASKWKTSNSDFPPKLKPTSTSVSASYHLYLIYSVTVLCVLLSTYSFSHTFKLQHEVTASSFPWFRLMGPSSLFGLVWFRGRFFQHVDFSVHITLISSKAAQLCIYVCVGKSEVLNLLEGPD